MPHNPDWTSPREGHDWQDDRILLAAEWLSQLADARSWSGRLEAVQARFDACRKKLGSGCHTELYDPQDTAAWYIFQARACAKDRLNWVPDEAARIVPILCRIGAELTELLKIPGAEERAATLMNRDRAQPDGGIFELLVALAYQRHGWTTNFQQERPGGPRTHDIAVSKARRHWAVECKRMVRSSYHLAEVERGKALAEPVHALARKAGTSLIIRMAYQRELHLIPDHYLAEKAQAYLDGNKTAWWEEEESLGYIREVDWGLARKVLAVDDVYYGSSRMIELIAGSYDHDADHSFDADWRPSRSRPLWAETVYRASLVSWRSQSYEAAYQKGRHFRSVVAGANGQLPGDRPAVVHVGIETWAGGTVDQLRHYRNYVEMRNFNTGKRRLRWVYGNIIAPEVTTLPDENWAVRETMAPYKVGRHSTPHPLPDHLLLTPENESRSGVHWDGED